MSSSNVVGSVLAGHVALRFHPVRAQSAAVRTTERQHGHPRSGMGGDQADPSHRCRQVDAAQQRADLVRQRIDVGRARRREREIDVGDRVVRRWNRRRRRGDRAQRGRQIVRGRADGDDVHRAVVMDVRRADDVVIVDPFDGHAAECPDPVVPAGEHLEQRARRRRCRRRGRPPRGSAPAAAGSPRAGRARRTRRLRDGRASAPTRPRVARIVADTSLRTASITGRSKRLYRTARDMLAIDG